MYSRHPRTPLVIPAQAGIHCHSAAKGGIKACGAIDTGLRRYDESFRFVAVEFVKIIRMVKILRIAQFLRRECTQTYMTGAKTSNRKVD